MNAILSNSPIGKVRLLAFDVDQYHAMIRSGILVSGSPVELLNGLLLVKDRSDVGQSPTSVGVQHAFVIDQLTILNQRLAPTHLIRIQQPVEIRPDSEPEPDGSILRMDRQELRHRLPTAAETLSVIEVAGGSLEQDRTQKLRIYAKANIPQYVIVNLSDGLIEDHQCPDNANGRYATRTILRRGDTLSLLLPDGSTLDVPVADLLP